MARSKVDKVDEKPNARLEENKQWSQLATMIEENIDAIEQRWLALVRVEVTEQKEVSLSDLRDSVAEYLQRVADSLRQTSPSNENLGSAVWSEVAQKHAVTRVHLGFNIEQLIREFTLLRKVLVDFARTRGLLVDTFQAETLTDLIDGAVSVAVKSYVDSRDYEFRKLEAVHIEFITHELRNPLTTAMMTASEICRFLPDSTKSKKLCELLNTSHSRLEKLINTFLLNEKIQSLDVSVKPIDTNLGLIVEESTKNFIQVAEKKGLHFHSEYDAQIPLHVDPNLTISAIQNLIENAVKYTDSGDIEFLVEKSKNEIVIHVRDHCSGISAEELRTIFEPFKRGQSRKPGSGLGLAIARRALELQGGQIHAESNEAEHGCHFWVNLPLYVIPSEKIEDVEHVPKLAS